MNIVTFVPVMALVSMTFSMHSAHAADLAIPPTVKPITISPDVPEHLRITGTMESVKEFKSEYLNNLHNIDIYLPPGFDAKDSKRYPVLYTIGWNTLFITGSADPIVPEGSIHPKHDSIVSLLQKGAIRPFIMISVSPDLDPSVNLMDECAPTEVKREREVDGVTKTIIAGGKAPLFAKFLIEEVKPWVDSTYPTLTDAANTGITGISKWGMGTLSISMNYPQVFGMWGGMSPALRWDNTVMARQLLELPQELPLKVWMGSGELEGHYLDHMELFKNIFIFKGIPKSDIEVLIVPGGNHSGQTWDPSVGPMLRFMFPVDDK